jgi:hypothetical protein
MFKIGSVKIDTVLNASKRREIPDQVLQNVTQALAGRISRLAL